MLLLYCLCEAIGALQSYHSTRCCRTGLAFIALLSMMSISTSSDARRNAASKEACVDIKESLVQALSEVHAAGVCLLAISADSIWVADDGNATFLDFSMAHEFVPGDLSITES